MTREHAQAWVMRCDRCGFRSEPRARQADHALGEYRAKGWHIAKVFGDLCPDCVAEERKGGAA